MAYADHFGWTPDEVDNLPLEIEPYLLPIHGLIEEVRANRARRESTHTSAP